MTTSVLCAVRGVVETQVVRVLGLPGSRAVVTRRCADLTELLAAAAAGLGTVAVVSADLAHLDREAVQHLHESRVWVVAIVDVRSGWTPDRARALGADRVVDAHDAEAQVPLAVAAGAELAAVATRTSASSATTGPSLDPGETRPGCPSPVASDHAGPVGAGTGRGDGSPTGGGDHGARGTVVAVWGPTGAPGRTTVALNLAAELADQGALLVDADTYGGTVAQMLGLLDEAPGVAAAARTAATGRLDAITLAALTPQLDGGLRVLTGLSRASRWPEVPGSSLEVVWSCARALAPWTVVDCGFSIEQDEALSYDTRAPRRNAATLSALAEADVVVVVGTGDPIGLQRLVRALGDLSDHGVAAGARRVVVNRVRASASGPRPAAAITDALRRYAGVEHAILIPEDRDACDGAVLAARTLREHAPTSPARRAVVGLADALAPARASAPVSRAGVPAPA